MTELNSQFPPLHGGQSGPKFQPSSHIVGLSGDQQTQEIPGFMKFFARNKGTKTRYIFYYAIPTYTFTSTQTAY